MKPLQVFRFLLFLCALIIHSALGAETYPRSWSAPQILNQTKLALLEGPVWDGGNNVYFTEINASKVYQLKLDKLAIYELHQNMHFSNGLAMDNKGQLWVAMQNKGQIVTLTPGDHSWQIHAAEYQGKPFNHPNDLVVDKHGGVYFSDPAWNTRHQKQPLNGVYYADKNGKVKLLIGDMDKPNGVLLSKKQDYFFVVDMGSREFRRYPVVAPGELGEREIFATLQKPDSHLSGPDGMAEDHHGNIYVAVDKGIQFFNAEGRYLGNIPLPEQVTNLAFVGKDLIIVTALENLYKIKVYFK